MIFNYSTEKYIEWGKFGNINFSRKLENETAFDGIIKIYSLQTDNEKMNIILKGLYFHKFSYLTTNGILLRKFSSKNSWPKTSLIHLNLDLCELFVIKRTKSSYDLWTVTELEENKYKISISPKEEIEFSNTVLRKK